MTTMYPLRVIKDGRILRHLSKKYKFEYDKKFKYVTSDRGSFEHKGGSYTFKYFDGCFYPFLIELI